MASKVDTIGLSAISEARASARKQQEGNEDYGSIYSHKSRSVCGGQKKKLHPLMRPSRQTSNKLLLHAASKNNLSEFTQRIMSAKLLRVKQVQNQLNETQIQLNELINENRILKNLQKRQEGALKKYEGHHAELPQLIRSHNEEIRTLKTSNKLIKAQLRESNAKLKERENELEALRDNYNKLKKLSTEKNLLEREKLQKKVEDLQDTIKEQEEKIQVLSRKILLESKNYRHHLNIEALKHKETQKDLSSALSMISKLESQLMSKEKIIPGGKIKRDNKNLMPVIVNKSTDIPSKSVVSEESYLNISSNMKKFQISDSPEPELELLNGMGSSDDTPSPTHDIFPNISQSKKFSPEMETTTEISPSKSEMFQFSPDILNTLKSRKTPSLKKPQKFASDLELNGKIVVEKLNEDMQAIDSLIQRVQETTQNPEFESTISTLMEEVKSVSSVKDIHSNSEKEVKSSNSKLKDIDIKRNVTKRKLEEEKETPVFDLQEELSEAQFQKLDNMSKTWNDIKTKIQEDRKKAEEKIRELNKMNGIRSHLDPITSDAESEQSDEYASDVEIKEEEKQELRFTNFTDDAYILQELEKTDKIFNRLKNENKKTEKKSSVVNKTSKTNVASKGKPKQQQQQQQQQNVQNFRTESHKNPKFLEEFQSEYQKQNLLKALKAIDVGKDPNMSAEESDDSEKKPKKDSFKKKNGIKNYRNLGAGDSNKKDLMTELFGSKHSGDKDENMGLELGTVSNTRE